MRNSRLINLFFSFLTAAFLLLAARCLYLQFFRHDYYSGLCQRQYQSLLIQKPQRGVILDCQGSVLAASNKIQTIFAEPRVIKDIDGTAEKLAPILKMDAALISKLIADSRNPGFIKIKVGRDVNECLQARKIYGIGILSDWERYYPTNTLACHVVGFTSDDNRGLGGIELQYDKQLQGAEGQETFLADALRRPIKLKDNNNVQDGNGLILTIDSANPGIHQKRVIAANS